MHQERLTPQQAVQAFVKNVLAEHQVVNLSIEDLLVRRLTPLFEELSDHRRDRALTTGPPPTPQPRRSWLSLLR